MRWLTNLVRDYFGFSATEMRGFWVLCFLAILLLIIPPSFKKISSHQETTVYSTVDKERLDSLVALLNAPEEDRAEEPELPQFQRFNPNIASKEVLLQNRLPTWLADRVIKYRQKGGQFRVKRDLLKIYGFSEELFVDLNPYIDLPNRQYAKLAHKKEYKNRKKHASYSSTHRRESLPKMDINLADSTSLERVQGIGKVLSARIVRFRDRLGGIHNPEQLSEVYQISPEAVQNLKKTIFISPDFETKKVNINIDDVSTLASHPYISFSLAKAIVKHRDDYGNFQSLTDCREVYLMDEVIFQKLIPYLSL